MTAQSIRPHWTRALTAMAAAAASAVAALILTAAPASAATSVSLDSRAAWKAAGTHVNVSGTATCTGGTGTVVVTVRQGQFVGTSNPVLVVCDGAPHSFAATVVGGPFELGNATATADLRAPDGGTASTTRQISIVI